MKTIRSPQEQRPSRWVFVAVIATLLLLPLIALAATCPTCNWKDQDSCGTCCIVTYSPTLKECGSPSTSQLECLTDGAPTTITWAKYTDSQSRNPCVYSYAGGGTFDSNQCFNDDTMCY